MLTNQDYDDLTRPVIELYNQLEIELIREIARRFETYDDVGGSLEWQVRKLNELGGLNKDTVKLIARLSGKSEKVIKEMLSNAGYASVPIASYKNIFDLGGIKIDPTTISIANVINNVYKEVNQTFRMIQTKAMQAVRQAYIEIINKAVIEVGSGIYDFNTSIKKATEEMVKKGFNYATYLGNDGTVRKTTIEAAVRRATLSAVNKMANESNHKFVEEMEAEYIETSWHEGARNKGDGFENHELWQGKVYKIHGEEPGYPNFEESTGYGDILGLGGVNCRHTHHAFFPGYSIPNRVPDDYDHDLYDQLQEQRKNERNIRYWKKREAAAEAIGDTDGVIKARDKIKEWSNRNQKLVDSNPKLRRDFARERVYNSETTKSWNKFDGDYDYSKIKLKSSSNTISLNTISSNSNKIVNEIIIPDGYNVGNHKEEIEFANTISNKLGGKLELLDESKEKSVKTPDYIWNGKLWDLKTVGKSSKNAIDKLIRKGIKQIQSNPGGIFLDVSKIDLDIDTIAKTVNERLKRSSNIDLNVMIFKDSELIKEIEYEYKKEEQTASLTTE